MLARLLGIVYLLLSRESMTASELAKRFEVSIRTVYRDVEALSIAGIPIYTKKGKHGGISLTENFVLNRMMFTKQEQESIMAALVSMEETGAGSEMEILEKLRGLFRLEKNNWLSIDLSDWSGRRKELFELLKIAILEHRVLVFDYYGQNHDMSKRIVEAVQLTFKDYTWYLRAFCREKQAMRSFKVMRMKRVECLTETFVPDPEKYKEHVTDRISVSEPPPEKIVLRVNSSEAWRIYDRFEEEEVIKEVDGNFLVQLWTQIDEWVYGMILSFGPAAHVIEPAHVKEEIRCRLLRMLEHYDKTNGFIE